jgi:demethylmenaquinone methyltransferase/2-methoxy-6-polyprenyl-1,4-benzoquinol methylase
MFDRISPRYDLLNHLLSLGLDRSWRREAVRRMAVGSGGRVLDVACGTADLALEAARSVPGGLVLGLDFSKPMIERARRKAERAGREDGVFFTLGAAERLPVADGSFDAAGIAFGIRNVPDRAKAVGEMVRAVRPGGRVVVLELASPPSGFLGRLVGIYLRLVVPRVGASLSSAGAYHYLVRSMTSFPSPEEFLREMEGCGLAGVRLVPLRLAPAWIAVGIVPK